MKHTNLDDGKSPKSITHFNKQNINKYFAYLSASLTSLLPSVSPSHSIESVTGTQYATSYTDKYDVNSHRNDHTKTPSQLIIPLEYIDDVYCMKYVIYNNNRRYPINADDISNSNQLNNDATTRGNTGVTGGTGGVSSSNNKYTVYRAIVDTGSPFLIVPSICTSMWGKGCLSSYQSLGLESSLISYGGQEYNTNWKKGNFSFFYQPSLLTPLNTLVGTLLGMLTCKPAFLNSPKS